MQEYQYVSRKIQIAIYGIVLTGKRIRKDHAVRIMPSLDRSEIRSNSPNYRVWTVENTGRGTLVEFIIKVLL